MSGAVSLRRTPRRLGRTLALSLLVAAGVAQAQTSPRPADVRRLARAAGLDSLRGAPVPTPSNLGDFLLPGTSARRAAVQLGKALFWDMQVGSDGQACGSCHFHAGADSRSKNQLHPGADGAFQPTASGGGGPDTDLGADDFPFHRLDDYLDRTSTVLHDTDDVVSSQGVFATRFRGLLPGHGNDAGDAFPDPVFAVGGVNVRRVARRNAPSVIDAVFNATNFWDGRAQGVFNGVSSLGPLDPTAAIFVDQKGKLVAQSVRIDHASLASQAMEPPRSDVEMAFQDRPFPALARKLLALRPLGAQLVDPRDGVLGPLARARVKRGNLVGNPGLTIAYGDLVKRAFQKKYWSSKRTVDGYSQMEENFSLFFGLSLQLYESTLVADRTPFDRFMDGDDRALDDGQQAGLLTFVNRGPGRSDDPAFADVFAGNCVSCHAGPALTTAATPGRSPVAVVPTVEADGLGFAASAGTAFRDEGFSNIGVRPTPEDPGRGALVAGVPLAFARQRLLGLPFAPPLPVCGTPGANACPVGGRVAVDGAFKIPGLRNVELTGPYFHDGGEATLQQVVAFYERLGDFSDANVADLDAEMARVDFREESEVLLVRFMLGLTDDRVRNEQAPFDHPQLFVPNGHRGGPTAIECVAGRQACDDLLEVPAVGANGRPDAGLPPLGTFLDLDPGS